MPPAHMHCVAQHRRPRHPPTRHFVAQAHGVERLQHPHAGGLLLGHLLQAEVQHMVRQPRGSRHGTGRLPVGRSGRGEHGEGCRQAQDVSPGAGHNGAVQASRQDDTGSAGQAGAGSGRWFREEAAINLAAAAAAVGGTWTCPNRAAPRSPAARSGRSAEAVQHAQNSWSNLASLWLQPGALIGRSLRPGRLHCCRAIGIDTARPYVARRAAWWSAAADCDSRHAWAGRRVHALQKALHWHSQAMHARNLLSNHCTI